MMETSSESLMCDENLVPPSWANELPHLPQRLGLMMQQSLTKPEECLLQVEAVLNIAGMTHGQPKARLIFKLCYQMAGFLWGYGIEQGRMEQIEAECIRYVQAGIPGFDDRQTAEFLARDPVPFRKRTPPPKKPSAQKNGSAPVGEEEEYFWSDHFSPDWMNSAPQTARELCNAMLTNIDLPEICVASVEQIFKMMGEAKEREALVLSRLCYQMADFLWEKEIEADRMEKIQLCCIDAARPLLAKGLADCVRPEAFLKSNQPIPVRPRAKLGAEIQLAKKTA